MNPDSSSPDSKASQPHEGEQPDTAQSSTDQSNEGEQPDIAAENEFSDVRALLSDLEASLQTLKSRYTDVLSAKTRRSELIAQYNRTQSELSRHRTTQLKSELKELQQKIDEAEVTLESQLFSWSSLKEPFWMAVRFGGLGILIGWLLRSVAG